MRTKEQRLLNLSAYHNYKEVLISSASAKIVLSMYESEREAPCVIFLPGTMTHPLFYDDFLTLLAENGFNVIGVHLISHGKSPRAEKRYSFADMLQNVQDTITFCERRFHENIIVMGSSQGGILSIAAAASDHRIKAVFPHNILIPSLKESILITRFPTFLKPLHGVFLRIMNIGAKFLPTLPIPITAYLELDRITASQEILAQFYSDPIGLTKYPLHFLASLFSADLTSITDGSIQCPVVVIASKGDALFPYSYTCQVFEKIVAPQKEMVLFDEPYHLIFNECIDRIIEPIVKKLREYS